MDPAATINKEETVDIIADNTAATYKPTIIAGNTYSTRVGKTFCPPLPNIDIGSDPTSVNR